MEIALNHRGNERRLVMEICCYQYRPEQKQWCRRHTLEFLTSIDLPMLGLKEGAAFLYSSIPTEVIIIVREQDDWGLFEQPLRAMGT
ncbi:MULTISPECIES: hypothetical protein [unclassified Pseudomonas]|uniref:hypothetical protein n=1 Tax=unclassified Pseudomonas TaxID=196821 RepID=UPI00111C6EB3|nr:MULTISPECIES: hypothetical protein [unclassified Pseudomonas]